MSFFRTSLAMPKSVILQVRPSPTEGPQMERARQQQVDVLL